MLSGRWASAPSRRRYVEAPVRENLYAVADSEMPPGWGVRWLDANGRTIDYRR